MSRFNFDPSLYLVLDFSMIGTQDLSTFLKAAISGGVSLVQFRDKKLCTKELVTIGRQIKTILQPLGIPFLVNDRADVALACEADGLHIGQSDLDYRDARKILGNNAIIGLSVETLEQAMNANLTDVDYLGVSPIFLTKTKPDAIKPCGLDGLKKLRKHTSKLLVAIGGINDSNANQVIVAGADGIAVVSAICASSNPELAARKLKKAISKNERSIL